MDSDEARSARLLPGLGGAEVGGVTPSQPASRPRTYVVDVAVSPRERDMAGSLLQSWDAQVGSLIPIPPSTPVGDGEYRIRIRHSKIADVVVEDLYSESIVGGTGGSFNHLNDRVVMHVGRTGLWGFAQTNGRRSTITLPGGQYAARLNDPSWDFCIGPKTRSTVLILPTAELRPLLGDRAVVGPVTSVEMRVLMAHVGVLQETLDELSPEGLYAARNSLIELAKGVLAQQGVDADEPGLAVALAEAARRVAESRLTDAELSPRLLAAELNVSVRTLQRAFAVTGESITAYVRRRRLECARQEILFPGLRLSVSELAARYHFADSSHFIRAFKKEFGHPPARLAHLGKSMPPSPDGKL